MSTEPSSERNERLQSSGRDCVNARTQSGRPWFRLHASTYVVMLLAATVLFFVNVPGQYVPYVDLHGQYSIEFPASERIEHGWPLTYLIRNEMPSVWNWNSNTMPQPVSVWSLNREVVEVYWLRLMADLAVAIVSLALVSTAFEYWRRQRHRLLQLRLIDLLAGVAVIAIAVAYSIKVASEFQREQKTLTQLGLPSLETLLDQNANPAVYDGSYDCSRGGPSWLRELMPESFPHWFDRVFQIEIDDARKLDLVRQFIHLRAVKVSYPGGQHCGAEQIAALADLRLLEAIEFNWFYPRLGSDEDYTDVASDAEFARGLTTLAKLPRLAGLDVAESTFGDQSAAAIADFPTLRVLDAVETVLTDKGLAHLGTLHSLEELHLDGIDITDEGARHLGELTGLKRLWLHAPYVSDECLRHIGALTELRELDLSFTLITGPELKHLRKLSKLESLALDKDVDQAAVADLQRHLPHLKISSEGNRLRLIVE